MPAYKKRRTFRRKPYKKRTKRNVATIARGVYRRMAEWKHHNVYVSGASGSGGGISALSDVPQGDTDLTRDGDQLYMGKLSFFLQWQSADTSNTMRCIIFQWFPATTPAVADILNSTSGAAPNYHYETDKAYQYKILYDKINTTNNKIAATTVYTGTTRRKIRPKRRKIQYQGGGTIGSNKIYLLLMTDSAVVTHPSAYFHSRLNFMDP